jgi:hypothetical protein
MNDKVIPIKLLRDIRNLRSDLNYMYKHYCRINHPMVLKASQKLDKKINEYYRIFNQNVEGR